MIKANELRIGNWVYDFGGNPVQVVRITKDKQPLETPIQITPKILEKCKIKLSDLNYLETWIQTGICDIRIGISFITYVNYLHQYQNLYFALTGEELEIKL